jgi:arylsulfatase A-like enzyme
MINARSYLARATGCLSASVFALICATGCLSASVFSAGGMGKRTRLPAGFLFSLLCLAPAAFAQPRPPNIIILLCDDLGYADLGFNGRKDWQTPNLDALAHQGTIFRRWYTAAAVCAPSRAALMTGRYSIHNGVTANHSYDLPADEVTIAQALKPHGYATALFGKGHHGHARPGSKTYTHPMDRGFDEFFGFTDAKEAWQKFPKKLWDGREEKPVQGYADTLFADHTVDFIQRHKDQPFFIYTPFIATHGVVEAPENDIAEHNGHFKEKDPAHPYNAIYAAEVTRLDKEVARILKTLDDLNLANDTIVIFSSDHGATFENIEKGASIAHDSNYPFRGQKRTLWEGGVHVPGVVRWPGHVPSGVESQELIHMIDLFPTLLAAAGVQPNPAWHIDGVNLLDTWLGKSPSPDRTIFWEWDADGNLQYAAMHHNLKLIITSKNLPEMYDVVKDPSERIDIKTDHPKETKALHEQLTAWLSTMSPASKLKVPTPKPTTQETHSVHDE